MLTKKLVKKPKYFSEGWPLLKKEYVNCFEVVLDDGVMLFAYVDRQSIKLWQSSLSIRLIKYLEEGGELDVPPIEELRWRNSATRKPLKKRVLYWRRMQPRVLILNTSS